MNRLLIATTFGILCGVLALGATIPGDARVARLAKEVHAKGWIVYSARTERGDWDLFLMRPDGSEQRNISNTPAFSELGGRFSPDGKKLLYRRIPKDSRINHDVWGARGELIIANADGTGATVYGKAGEFSWASWSPDGKQLACLTKTGIEICDVATKKVLRKLDRKGIYQQLFWSPDGQWLTGTANHYGESWTVVRMNASTGEVNPLAKFQNCTPDWSPDSKRLIYSSRPAHQEESDGGKLARSVGQSPGYGWTQLWIVDGDGRRNSLVYGEDSRHIYGGALSPDGRYVVFTRSSVDGGLGIGDNGAPMALMRLDDAPTIGGESKALRKLFPHTKDGPVLPLPDGWEPHWTYAEGQEKVTRSRSLSLGLALALVTFSCAKRGDSGVDEQVMTLGTIEVAAKLVEIRDPFPPNDLYNYAYVLKYKVLAVHRGKVDGDEILVAHYNPLKPRSSAQDEFSGKVGGRLDRFRAGDVHRMALEAPLDNFWMGGVVDKYFDQKGVRYWAVWTNLKTD